MSWARAWLLDPGARTDGVSVRWASSRRGRSPRWTRGARRHFRPLLSHGDVRRAGPDRRALRRELRIQCAVGGARLRTAGVIALILGRATPSTSPPEWAPPWRSGAAGRPRPQLLRAGPGPQPHAHAGVGAHDRTLGRRRGHSARSGDLLGLAPLSGCRWLGTRIFSLRGIWAAPPLLPCSSWVLSWGSCRHSLPSWRRSPAVSSPLRSSPRPSASSPFSGWRSAVAPASSASSLSPLRSRFRTQTPL